MDAQKIISELKAQYPDKNIILNNEENPTEILCEIDPGADKSIAIAVIDETIEHVHRKTTEIYEILKGELKITKDGKEYVVNEGESFVIHPDEYHKAEGHETWIKVISEPGWNPEDHIVVNGE